MQELTYEKAISRLEEIVSKLESNEIPLEDSIALLSQYCDKKLKNIQEKVAQIYENGQLKEFQSEE